MTQLPRVPNRACRVKDLRSAFHVKLPHSDSTASEGHRQPTTTPRAGSAERRPPDYRVRMAAAYIDNITRSQTSRRISNEELRYTSGPSPRQGLLPPYHCSPATLLVAIPPTAEESDGHPRCARSNPRRLDACPSNVEEDPVTTQPSRASLRGIRKITRERAMSGTAIPPPCSSANWRRGDRTASTKSVDRRLRKLSHTPWAPASEEMGQRQRTPVGGACMSS